MGRVQGSARRLSPGLENFVTAVAYHFCLSLPAAFTQPGSRLLADLCTPSGLWQHQPHQQAGLPPCPSQSAPALSPSHRPSPKSSLSLSHVAFAEERQWERSFPPPLPPPPRRQGGKRGGDRRFAARIAGRRRLRPRWPRRLLRPGDVRGGRGEAGVVVAVVIQPVIVT